MTCRWINDAIGRAKSTSVLSDPDCSCACSKCLCNVKDLTDTNQGSANCNPVTYTKLVALPDLTTAKIQAARDKRASFNPGLYYRSRIMGKSKTGTVDTVVTSGIRQ